MSVTITIPNWHPCALNKLLGHHMVAYKRKKADRNIIATYTRHLPSATTKRRVHLTLVYPAGVRSIDPDSPQKSLGDALKHAKAIKNDSHLWVEWMPMKVERGDMATIITLEDMA